MNSFFIFLFLILFPFGQIIRFGILQPLDVVVGLAAVYTIVKRLPKPGIFKYLSNFLLIAGFSWIISVFVFKQIEIFYGLLYLFRLIAYSYFLIYVWNFVKSKAGNKSLLLNSLLILSLVSSLFGWIQFFKFPDIKPFFTYGWDEHLYRLVGTFLDPTFLGLIIVFGLLLSINQFFDTKKKSYLLSMLFLFVSLAFTYSRASYLAFAGGALLMGYYKKYFKPMILITLGLILVALITPTAKNRSIELFRSFSVVARVENYKETIKIFKKSPLIGVGFNNICLARQKYIRPASFSSHACSGSDSSLLLILATTGVVGLIIFAFGFYSIWRSIPRNSYFLILNSCLIALFIHSFFSNSLFYSWIMGYMAILLSLNLRGEVEG